MFDVEESLSLDEVLRHPTVLELDAIGDDDDKAFFIGLLFIRLVECRRRDGPYPHELRHLLVVEEAHRLFTNVSRNPNEEQSDPRGKAVETFSNLISEIRAYGQGVVIVDQVPTRLAPDVIKNTNLKIAHRVVAGDDRKVLGNAMAMSDRQAAALSSLQTGRAVVFSGESDDTPVLVKVRNVKDKLSGATVSGAAIREQMSSLRSGQRDRYLFRQTLACEENCPASAADFECSTGKEIVETTRVRAALARLALSVIENPSTAARLWADVLRIVQGTRPPATDEQRVYRCVAVRGAASVANRRGAQGGWSYSHTRKFETALRSLLLSFPPINHGVPGEASREFRQCALELHARRYAPYRRCEVICTQPGPVCLYRFAAADLLATSMLKSKMTSALVAADDEATDVKTLWAEGQQAGWRLVALDSEAAEEEHASTRAASIRASLCFAQQVMEGEPSLHPRRADDLLDGLLSVSSDNPHLVAGEQ